MTEERDAKEIDKYIEEIKTKDIKSGIPNKGKKGEFDMIVQADTFGKVLKITMPILGAVLIYLIIALFFQNNDFEVQMNVLGSEVAQLRKTNEKQKETINVLSAAEAQVVSREMVGFRGTIDKLEDTVIKLKNQLNAPKENPPAAVPVSGSKIAILDYDKVIVNYDKNNERIGKVMIKAEEIQNILVRLNDKIKGLEQRLELFDPNSEEYKETILEIEECKLKAMDINKRETRKIEMKQVAAVNACYNDIRGAVKVIAEKNNYNVVLLAPRDTNVGYKKLQDVFLKIRSNEVLYNSDTLDITQEVIEYLNNQNPVRPQVKNTIRIP